jgi:hypothetical protein
VVIDGERDGIGNYKFRLLDKANATVVNLDTDITGTFDNGGIESDSYRFTLTDRQYLYFDGQIGNYDNAWILYGSGGQYITSKTFYQNLSSDSYNDGELWLDSGDYWLVMQGNGAESWNGGNHNYKLRIVTPQLNTAPMTLDTIISGSISETGEQDTYTFTGTAGQQLFYDALGGDYLKLRFFDPTGREIFNVDSRYDRAPHDGLTLALNGTYRVVIDGERDGIGNYKFRLLDKANATVVNLDTDITGTFDNGGIESDSYRFTLTDRQYLYFDGQIGNYDNAWILYGSGGQYITHQTLYQNQSALSYNDRELWLDSGDYWLVMQGNGAESWTGGNNDYKLRIVTPQLNTAPMTIGTVISGSISETGEQDYYTFEGTAGQRLFFDSLVNTNNTYVYLTAPSGKIIVNGHHSRNNLIDIVLDESGTYRLAIDGSGETTENYGFRLLEYGAAFSLAKSQANSITLNTEITGSFDDPQQRESDFYRFNSSAGQYLYIDVLSGDSPNGWTIFRPNGDLLISGYIYEDKEISLSDTGEYTLEVWGNGSGNRNYKLKLITPELNTVAYTLGTTVSNTISQKGEQDTYTFAGNAGQWLYLDILNGNSNLKARLYSPTGVLEVDGDTNTDWTPRLLKETGTYRLVIDGAGETTGNYSFVMRERAQASTITLGTTLSEQINQTNGVKLYQITGQTGQVLNFNYLGQILTPKIDPATGHAYVLTDLPGTWTEVQSIAQGMGGNLVSINSAAENAFLVNQFGTYSFWIGLTDAAVEGNWKQGNRTSFCIKRNRQR